MLFDKGTSRLAAARREPRYRPTLQYLEERVLLAGAPVLDLGGTVAPNGFPAIAVSTTASTSSGTNFKAGPFGVDLGGGVPSGGAGWSVTDVGDMTGDGYDDYLIGSPDVNYAGGVNLGGGVTSTAYLIFGSNEVTLSTMSTIENWLDLQTLESTATPPALDGTFRVGDLSQLGNVPLFQQNPISGDPGFAFNGITFVTTGTTASTQLGASVAVVPGGVNGNPAFLIGAPGADALGDTTNGFPNYGRAYLIIGGSKLATLPAHTVINLDSPSTSPINFVTFGAAIGAGPIGIGSSVAGLSNFFNDGANMSAIAIGAPNATFNNLSDAGAVFVVQQAGYAGAIGSANPVINLTTVGQTTGIRGTIFGGNAAGDFAGFSLANAGDVDGVKGNSNQPIPDLLIGAPGTNNAATNANNNMGGTAYLIYGGSNLLTVSTTFPGLNTATLRSISLGSIGDPTVTTGDFLGAVFTGTPGDATGYSVATAGDVNNDGFADFLIGSPLANRATLIFGQNVTTNLIKGAISLTTPPLTIQTAIFTGPALTGYSVSGAGKVKGDKYDDFLIGAPGYMGNQGAAFLVSGRPYFAGTYPLNTNDALLMTVSSAFGTTPNFFGASVSGIPYTTDQTADADIIPDPIIGAPGYGVATGRSLDGGAFITEGAFIQPLMPSQLATTDRLVATPTATSPPLVSTAPAITSVNATGTVITLLIFGINNYLAPGNNFNASNIVTSTSLTLSSSLANFVPVPVTATVVPLTDSTNTNPPIIDAIVTINLLANNGLNLINGSQTLTFSGLLPSNVLTNVKSQLVGEFTGTFNAVVSNGAANTGGGGGTGTGTSGGVGAAPPIGAIVQTFFQPPYGATLFVPQPSTLSTLDYKPIPKRVAYKQFEPSITFRMRILNYVDPAKYHFQANRSDNSLDSRAFTLSEHTYNTSVYHPGKTVVANHKTPVIPVQEQHQTLTPRSKKK